MKTQTDHTRLTEEEVAAFEAWARKKGYSTKKEGKRYCQGVVNEMLDALIEFKRAEARKGQA